jgi:PIN domain nuclease of toxin-antitoxin system
MSLRVLLDTNVILFALLHPRKLSMKAKTLLEDKDTVRFLSPVSWYEIGLKVRIGKLNLPDGYDCDLALTSLVAKLLPITTKHMIRAANLPLDNRDPFDRILVAQAVEDSMFLLSADEHLAGLNAPRLW